MRELTSSELNMVSGAAPTWTFHLAEFPYSAPGTWQRRFDNFEDNLENPHPYSGPGGASWNGMLNYGDGALGNLGVNTNGMKLRF